MTNIGPESTKVETEVTVINKITIGPDIGLIAGTITKIIIEEEETTLIEVVVKTTGPITEIVVGPETETIIEMGIGTTIDQAVEETIVTRGMETEVRIAAGPGIEIGVVQEKVPNPEVEINLIGVRVQMKIGDRVEIIPETDLNQGQDQAPM